MPNPDLTAPNVTPSSTLPVPLQTAVGSAARWGMTLAAGWLVQQGIASAANSGAVTDLGVAAILGLFSLGWSLAQKYVAERALAQALALPAGSTKADLKA